MSVVLAPPPPEAGRSADPVPAPGRRRAIRRLVTFGALGAVVVAGFVVWHRPTDLYAERPGPILALDSRVTPQTGIAPITPIDGAFDGLTVELRSLDLGSLVIHYLSGDRATIVTADDIRPHGISQSTYDAVEKVAYVDGGQVAAAVAERALGYTATISTDGLEIFDVTPGSAADGVFSAGERIIAVDGARITSPDDLAAAVQASGGDPITVTVVDGSSTRAVVVTPRATGPGGSLLVGVSVTPADQTVDLQVPVTIDASNVEGPSAGLMTALTVYDELSPTDLAGGRKIAGTGTLALDGTVGEIGGIDIKARAARAAGADLFLAPASQAAEARAVLGDAIPVIGVTTFGQAVTALTGNSSRT